MGRKIKPGVRGLAYGCAVAATLACAIPVGAQTLGEPDYTAGSEAFAPVRVESTLSLSSLQVTPISAWRMSDTDLDKLRVQAAMVRNPFVPRPVSPVAAARKRSSSNVALKRTLAGVAGGVAGFFVGGYLGAFLEGDCGCDDPGLLGFVVGAPIGAAVGAIVGVLAVR